MKKSFVWSLVALVQIFLLVNMTTAYSYSLKETNQEILNFSVKEENKLAKIIISIFSIKQFGVVSAAEVKQCCIENKNGAICQEYSSSLISEACDAENIVQASCEEVSQCQIGTCIDEEQGTCSTRSPKGICEAEGGVWDDDPNGNIPECRKGCCVVGDNVEFTTEQRCDYISNVYGFEKDYRQATNELECLALAPEVTLKNGACVVGESCRFSSAQECLKLQGEFHEGLLCSNPSLETQCERQTTVSCVEGKDEIYWFDSCGNRENIYSSDKDASWNEGKVLAKENSCDPNSANYNSETCGNCNYLLGSSCSATSVGETSIEDGNYVCEDLRCEASEETGGVDRENGESWCVYDSYIGDGKDPAGSRHWKRICKDGEIEVEPCADYRGEICVQSDVNIEGDDLSSAACVVNRAMECINYNSDAETTKERCMENSACQLTEVDVDEGFKFEICTAKYPGGFDFSGENKRASESATQLCSMANQKCTVIYQKQLFGGWECIQNCECETEKFSEEMNNLCVGLGDCGSYINYVGEGTNNVKVSNAPKVSWEDYIEYATPVDGQKADPMTQEEINRITGGSGSSGSLLNITSISSVSAGALGVGALVFSKYMQNIGLGAKVAKLFGLGKTASGAEVFSGAQVPGESISGLEAQQLLNTQTSWFSVPGFLNALSGAAVGASVGGLVAKMFGLEGSAALATVVGGAIGGGIGALQATGALGGIGAGFSTGISTAVSAAVGGVTGTAGLGGAVAAAAGAAAAAAVIGLIVALVVAAVMKILGIGKIKKVVVKFTCNPWQPPTGGENCELCNDDPLKPCTEYRCSSLGKACQIINEESSSPECVAVLDDGRAPVISTGSTSEGFKYENADSKSVSLRTIEGQCVPEFTPVTFTLNTDERAQCKYDFVPDLDYDQMSEYSLEGTFYTLNHSFGFTMPSLESLQSLDENIEISGDIIQQLANWKMAIKCQDIHGNTNPTDYFVDICTESGPDRTAPRITLVNPANGAKIKKGSTENQLTVYTNEPAECKYDLTGGKLYDEMANTMECSTDVNDPAVLGWECKTTLTNLQDENIFYIKCRDKPWETLIEERNTNSEDYEYKLSVTTQDLKIDSVLPQGKKELGVEPATITLEAQTSGGGDSGNAMCHYSFVSYDKLTSSFYNSGKTTHKQNFNLVSGKYNIYLKCIDKYGNEALGNATFELELDSSAPVVQRVYKKGESLTLVTDEEAACYYDFNSCSFDINNATEMTSGFSRTHSTKWNPGLKYYIKCEDVWGNQPSDCNIQVAPTTEVK